MIELPSDFKDLLAEFDALEVEYLLVGGYAVMAHGFTRATEDFDIWVRPTPDNAKRVWSALQRFGAPTAEWSLEDFSTPGNVLFFGCKPFRIDLLTTISGVDFEQAWVNRHVWTAEDLRVPVIGRDELIRNKLASGRDKDIIDARRLQKPSRD